MKKYMLPGLITAMALSLPVAALAQTSPTLGTQQAPGTTTYSTQSSQYTTPSSTSPSTMPYSSQSQSQMNMPASGVSNQQSPMTPYSSQTGQITTPNTGVGSQQSPMTPYSSQTSQMNTAPNTGVSNQQQTTTQSQTTVGQTTTTTTTTNQVSTEAVPPNVGEVIVGTDAASSVVPPLTIGMNSTTSITVVNPTPKPVSFTVPNLNLTYEVPGNSQRTIQIDRTQTANLTPGQTIAYYINDSSGNQIASSNLTDYQPIASQINTDTTVATEEQKQEPSYQSSPQSRSRSTVRGYW